nr:uncharacterized protein CI109_006652 [Kwoniella shandongensis]KAA5525012.1 hypothetical protein CI109_006652 [Kwoniella shandongensis]
MLSAFLGQLVCVGAVWIASDRALKTSIAISSLHTKTGENCAETTHTNDQPIEPANRSPSWRRAFSKRALSAYLTIGLVLSFEMFVMFGLPKLTTIFFLDLFWSILLGVIICMSFFKALHIIFRPASFLRIETIPNNPMPKLIHSPIPNHPSPFFLETPFRLPVCIALTIAILGSAYNGYYACLPLVAAAYTIMILSVYHMPKVSMRKFYLGVAAIIATIFTVIAIIVLVANIFSNEEDKPAEEKDEEFKMFSPWIGRILTMFNLSVSFNIPAIIMALTLRYEHSVSPLAATHPLPKDGHAIVPAVLPYFPRPIFITGIVSSILGVGSLYVFTMIVPPPEGGFENGVVGLFVIPFVFLGMPVAAWWTGQFQSWWTYSEEWFPKPEAAVAKNSDDVEKGLEEEQVVDDLLDVKA